MMGYNGLAIKVILFCCYCLIIPSIMKVLGVGGVASAIKSKPPSSYSLSDILDDLDLHSDNRVRPGYGERALQIHAFTYLRNIVEINERESSITANLLFMQIWEDPRLSFPFGHGVHEILIDNPDFMSRFWSPDTFIVNEVQGNHGCNSGPNLANQIVKLTPNGNILKTARLTVTVSCPMRHRSYPFHNFECDIELESFGHKADDILFVWRNGSKSVDYSKIDKIALAAKSSYALEGVETHSQQSYLDTGGSYSKLIVRIRLSKLWLRHAITFFIPTIFLTAASLITLWIFKNSIITGIITNFIIAGLVILLGGLEYSVAPILTQVPFLTPVDVHLGICLFEIFITIAYHGVVLCMTQSGCIGKSSVCSSGDDKFADNAAAAGHSSSNPGKFITAQDILKESENNDRQVTYYESFDVTNNEAIDGGHHHDDDEQASSEQHQFMKKRADVLDEEGHHLHHHHHSNKASAECSGSEGSSSVAKVKAQTIKVLQRCSTHLLGASLTISRWIILCLFILAEAIFWYTYLSTD